MEGLPGTSVFLYSSSTPLTDVCSVHINCVKSQTSLQIEKIWGWTSKRNFLRFLPTEYATIFRSYSCFAQETEREKNKKNFEGKRIKFCWHRHFFIYLFSGSYWVENRRETDAYARFCRRISAATLIKSSHAEDAQTKCPSAVNKFFINVFV